MRHKQTAANPKTRICDYVDLSSTPLYHHHHYYYSHPLVFSPLPPSLPFFPSLSVHLREIVRKLMNEVHERRGEGREGRPEGREGGREGGKHLSSLVLHCVRLFFDRPPTPRRWRPRRLPTRAPYSYSLNEKTKLNRYASESIEK